MIFIYTYTFNKKHSETPLLRTPSIHCNSLQSTNNLNVFFLFLLYPIMCRISVDFENFHLPSLQNLTGCPNLLLLISITPLRWIPLWTKHFVLSQGGLILRGFTVGMCLSDYSHCCNICSLWRVGPGSHYGTQSEHVCWYRCHQPDTTWPWKDHRTKVAMGGYLGYFSRFIYLYLCLVF